MRKENKMKNHLTLKEFLGIFTNESYDIAIVNGNKAEGCDDYVIIKTNKKYVGCLKEKILESTVCNFEISYDDNLIIEVLY